MTGMKYNRLEINLPDEDANILMETAKKYFTKCWIQWESVQTFIFIEPLLLASSSFGDEDVVVSIEIKKARLLFRGKQMYKYINMHVSRLYIYYEPEICITLWSSNLEILVAFSEVIMSKWL